jgi:hypothetical protein
MSSTEGETLAEESYVDGNSESRSNGDSSRPSELAEQADSPDLPVALAAVASVLYSWYMFYVREDELYGLFVGLWPPTLLAFASYLRTQEADESS